MHIYCCLHCSPLTFASVYKAYILCFRFDTLGCNDIILWYIDPFLGKDLETNERTTVAVQQIGKRTSTTIELLLETVCSIRSVKSGYRVVRGRGSHIF
jgi:hypothetical protein